MSDLLGIDFVKLILEKLCEPALKKTGEFTKDQWEKFKIDFDISFRKYLNKSYEKYSKVKTILYRTEPQYIYNFFEIPYLKKKNNEVFKVDDVNDVLNISHFIIIQGTGGIGKSMLMKHLFLNALEKRELIPVFFELKDVNAMQQNYKISDMILNKLNDFGANLNEKCLEYALQSGCFLFLLDGYDEILTSNKDDFFHQLETFCDKYDKNYYILSSRPYSEFIEFQRFSVLSTCILEKEQAVSLIKKIDFDNALKARFIRDLNDKLYDKHISFASNPLLLNIMLLTYDNYAEIPEKLHLFYSNAFETLYSRHDATKAGFRREIKSKLSYDLFKKVFSYFCFISYAAGKIEFSRDDLVAILKKITDNGIKFDVQNYIYDLINSVCVLYKDGLNYKFSHRSFQEYFSALFLKELSDDKMREFSKQLIYKGGFRIAQDSVFDMLYDMTEDRFEQNILLPILLDYEMNSDEEKLYDFYFKRLVKHIKFQDDIDKEGKIKIRLWLGKVMSIDVALEIIYRFSFAYSKGAKQNIAKNKKYSDKLLDYLIKNKSYHINNIIATQNILEDTELYNLLKETWIGDCIKTIASLSNELTKKQKNNEKNLDDLLIW